jgi:hypothetical protein
MYKLSAFLANLEKAYRDNDTLTIGGGLFEPDDYLPVIELLRETLRKELNHE